MSTDDARFLNIHIEAFELGTSIEILTRKQNRMFIYLFELIKTKAELQGNDDDDNENKKTVSSIFECQSRKIISTSTIMTQRVQKNEKKKKKQMFFV